MTEPGSIAARVHAAAESALGIKLGEPPLQRDAVITKLTKLAPSGPWAKKIRDFLAKELGDDEVEHYKIKRFEQVWNLVRKTFWLYPLTMNMTHR